MTKNLKCTVFIIYLFLSIYQSFASDLFDRAVAAFRENRPKEAQKLILEVLDKEGPDASLYNYLGIAYCQMGDYEKSVDAFIKGSAVPFANKALLFYNAANAVFYLEDYRRAEKYYSESIGSDAEYAKSYLNRANTRMKLEKKAEALADYTRYLELNPYAAQKENIEKMIVLLSQTAAK